MSVVKINVLSVPAGMGEELERRFAARAGLVDSAEGFEGFELLRPVGGMDRYLVYTRWRSEQDFQRWSESQDFQRGHAQAAREAQAEAGRADGHTRGQGQGQGQGHGHGHGQRGPAAQAAELWSFEVVQRAEPEQS
jgi:heme-degrading monooxygenase HmoA